MKMQRRDFLKTSSVASGALLMPRFLHKLSPLDLRDSRKLIVIQLSGGNDGLNTFVPFEDDIYHRNRPGLGLRDKDVLKVSDEQGFHASLAPLRDLYDRGMLSILNAVGYPNPDRSHFRSMDIWQMGKVDDKTASGWIGRYLDHNCSDCAPHHALEIGNDLSLALQGEHRKGMVLENPDQLLQTMANPQINAVMDSEAGYAHSDMDFMYKTLVDTRQSAAYLAQLGRQSLSSQAYPPTDFGRDMKLVADLILAGGETHVFYLSLSGFDTHIRQQGQHRRLLSTLASGVRALTDDLRKHGKMQDVLILCFSEFGRRVRQNASGGTDHGAGNNVFLIADRLETPGFFNAPPDLSDLDEGDVRYQVDFRQVYAEVLEQWMGVVAMEVLERKVTRLGVLG